MRYIGQSYELKVLVPRETITQPVLKKIERQFLEEHTRRYGFFFEHENIEFVNLRVTALGLAPKIQLSKQKARRDSSVQALKRSRPVYFRDEDYVECSIYDRERLSYGNTIHGPAIIEQRDSTTVLHPNHKATVDGYGRIIISRRN